MCRQKNQDAEYAVSCESTSITTLFSKVKHCIMILYFSQTTLFCFNLWWLDHEASPKFESQNQFWTYFCWLMSNQKIIWLHKTCLVKNGYYVSFLCITVLHKWGHATMQPITEGDYLIAYPINTYINLAPRLANTWYKSYATLLSHMPLTNCSLDLSSTREPFTFVKLAMVNFFRA